MNIIKFPLDTIKNNINKHEMSTCIENLQLLRFLVFLPHTQFK